MFTKLTTKNLALAAALLVSITLTACGPHDAQRFVDQTPLNSDPVRGEVEPQEELSVATTTPPATVPVTTAVIAPVPPSTTAPSTTSGPTGFESPTVAGEPIADGPTAGQPLIIVGVHVDDVLNFRIAPSPNAAIATSYPVTLTELDIFALGEAWAAPTGVWLKVNVMGTEAWANQAFLASRGGSAPIFDEVAQELQILTAGSIEELALDVAATRATVEPASRITIVTEPFILPLGDGGGVGHVFVDVLDIGDPLQMGERLSVEFDVVFDLDTPEPNDIAFIVLHGVEMIYLQAP